MARSAERAIEQQHLQQNVQRAIDEKQRKAQAAEFDRLDIGTVLFHPLCVHFEGF